jgi:hypothetical protein
MAPNRRALGLLGTVLLFGCSDPLPVQSDAPLPIDAAANDDDPAPGPVIIPGGFPATEPRGSYDLSGRWTSSLFKDSIEVRFRHGGGGGLDGRVCGAPSQKATTFLEGGNCGEILDGWVREDGYIHFVFVIPWEGFASDPVRYELSGGFDRGTDSIRASMYIDTASTGRTQASIVFTRCPDLKQWCTP